MDTGYVDAELLVSSQQDYGIKLVGPVLSDNSWQAKAGKGFDAAHFQIDWQANCATCPQGQQSARWTPLSDPERIEIVFARDDLRDVPVPHGVYPLSDDRSRAARASARCPGSLAGASITNKKRHHFGSAIRHEQALRPPFHKAVRGMGMRRARYDGLHKTHLQHVLTAVAINLVRIDAVLTQTPRGTTRQLQFRALGIASCFAISEAA